MTSKIICMAHVWKLDKLLIDARIYYNKTSGKRVGENPINLNCFVSD